MFSVCRVGPSDAVFLRFECCHFVLVSYFEQDCCRVNYDVFLELL